MSPIREGEILWHSFSRGREGYYTDAKSSELSDHLADALQRYAWGQARSGRYHATLGVDPAFWIESIEGSIAITRILPGEVDPAGRSTFRFFSLVVARAVYRDTILPRLAAILRSQEIWRPSAQGSIEALVESLPISAPRTGTSIDRLSALIATDPMAASIVVAPGAVDLDDVCEILRRINDAPGGFLSVAYRSLSDAIGCGLVLLDADSSPEPSKFRRITIDVELRHVGDEPGIRLRERRIVRSSGPAMPIPFPSLQREYANDPDSEDMEMNAKTISAFVVLAACVVSFGIANLWFSSKSAEARAGELRERVDKLETRLAADVERRRSELSAEMKKKIAEFEKSTVDELKGIVEDERKTREALTKFAEDHGAAVASSGRTAERLEESVVGVGNRIDSVDKNIVEVQRRFSNQIDGLATKIAELQTAQDHCRETLVALTEAEPRPTSPDTRPSNGGGSPAKNVTDPKKRADKPVLDKSKEGKR